MRTRTSLGTRTEDDALLVHAARHCDSSEKMGAMEGEGKALAACVDIE
jgi:hypothetical protein